MNRRKDDLGFEDSTRFTETLEPRNRQPGSDGVKWGKKNSMVGRPLRRKEPSVAVRSKKKTRTRLGKQGGSFLLDSVWTRGERNCNREERGKEPFVSYGEEASKRETGKI